MGTSLLWFLLPCLLFAARRGLDSTTNRVTRVNIIVSRHALSCANLVSGHAKGSLMRTAHTFMTDPMLAECGVYQTRAARAALTERRVDFVLTSSLLRAMETAIHLFPGHVIFPSPYISEHAFGFDNTPRKVEEQVEELSRVYGEYGNVSINFEWMLHPFYGQNKNRFGEPNFKDFIDFLSRDFFPRYLPEPRAEVNIVVVTHSYFMKSEEPMRTHCAEFWDSDRKKPSNNQILELAYDLTTSVVRNGVSQQSARHLQLAKHSDGSACKSLYRPPKQLDVFCKQDVGPVCDAAIQKLSVKPQLKLREWRLAKGRSLYNRLIAKFRMSQAVSVSKNLEKLERMPCCVT